MLFRSEVVLENVHLAESLMRLSYKLKNANNGREGILQKGEDELEEK